MPQGGREMYQKVDMQVGAMESFQVKYMSPRIPDSTQFSKIPRFNASTGFNKILPVFSLMVHRGNEMSETEEGPSDVISMFSILSCQHRLTISFPVLILVQILVLIYRILGALQALFPTNGNVDTHTPVQPSETVPLVPEPTPHTPTSRRSHPAGYAPAPPAVGISSPSASMSMSLPTSTSVSYPPVGPRASQQRSQRRRWYVVI